MVLLVAPGVGVAAAKSGPDAFGNQACAEDVIHTEKGGYLEAAASEHDAEALPVSLTMSGFHSHSSPVQTMPSCPLDQNANCPLARRRTDGRLEETVTGRRLGSGSVGTVFALKSRIKRLGGLVGRELDLNLVCKVAADDEFSGERGNLRPEWTALQRVRDVGGGGSRRNSHIVQAVGVLERGAIRDSAPQEANNRQNID